MSAQLNNVIELLNRWGEVHWNFAVAMFFQVSTLIVVLLCLDFTVLRRLRASIRYALWMLVLVKLVLPVSLHTPVSVSRWMPNFQPEPEEAAESRSEVAGEAVPISMPRVIQRGSEPVRRAPAFGRGPENEGARQPFPEAVPQANVRKIASSPTPSPVIAERPESGGLFSAATASPPLLSLSWKAYAVLVWTTVALILLILFIRRAWLVRRIVAASSAAPDELELQLVECLELTKGSGQRVRVRVSDALGSPAICGFWSGTILLPGTLLEKLDRRQLQSILVHELTHWHRFDLQVNCLQTLLWIVYFYNPLMWLANVILRRAREQAVDEAVLATLDFPAEDYSTTLLDIASLSRRPAELTLRMVGVVESRKALSGRIKRILSRPIPRSARLGITGVSAILITGLVLLPMSGNNNLAISAQDVPIKVVAQRNEPEATRKGAAENADEDSIVLIGRIIDETGRSVTDANVEILHVDGGKPMNAKTNEHGYYRIDNIDKPGRYRMTVDSKLWVGLSYRDRVEVTVTPGKENARHFALKRACSIRIRTVDEDGRPVPEVTLMANNLATERHLAPDGVPTDTDGWATVGGLAPSKTEYLIATWKVGYAFERLVIKLDDPKQIPEHEIVLHAGKTIKGTAVCSDGKPPADWRITALPSWWHFGRSPAGTKIAEDGSFTLAHIGRDKYDVTISVPSGDSGSNPQQVLKQTNLFDTEGLLKLKMDHPSPFSMVYITGHVKIIGKPKEGGFWVFANSREPRYHKGVYMRGGQTEFKIGPLIKGTYQLKVENVGLDGKPVTVTAPAEDVELVVEAFAPPKLKGTVVDARTKQPISPYRLRLYKLRTLRGPNYVQKPDWRTFKNDGGQFEYEVHGPGVYKVQIAAEDYAWQFSDEINTDENGGKPLQIALSEGVSLTGTVVDQAGQPIDGATVVPLSRAMGTMPASTLPFDTAEGAVRTRDGKFELNHLSAGKSSLKVTHSDYCFTIVPDVVVGPERGEDPVRITLTVGGTVRGRVFDAEGRPEPNVTLYFQDSDGYSGGGDEEKGRFASAVTDADGFYEVDRLPSQLIYVNRADPWQSLGVVRHAILPENGQVHTLDFGGDKLLTGRLLINAKPLAEGELILSGDSPHFGIFRAQVPTQSDGSFTFRGVPPRRAYPLLRRSRPERRIRTSQYDRGHIR